MGNLLDPVRDFALMTVSGSYVSTDSSVVLATGQGALLPDPSVEGAFNGTWFDATDYPDIVSDPNREIVRVTAVSGDTLTITRAQEGTYAANHNIPGKTYMIVFGLSKKFRDDIESYLEVPAPMSPQTIVTASVSGSCIFTEPILGDSLKRVMIYCNTMSGSASYTFPTAFEYTPVVLATDGLPNSVVSTISTTDVAVSGSNLTGFVVIEGF